MAFERAQIEIVRVAEFKQLQAVIERVFSAGQVEKLLKALDKDGLRARQWDAILDKQVLEKVDEELRNSGTSARRLYDSLTVSDQGQMRELFLLAIEQVEPGLRARYNKLYRYY